MQPDQQLHQPFSSDLVPDKASSTACSTITGHTVITAGPSRAAFEDVSGHPLLGDCPLARVGPHTVTAGVELVPAAGTLASVVVTLSLLEELAGSQEPGLRFLGRRFACCDVCVALWDGDLGQLDLGGDMGCKAEENQDDGGQEAHGCWRGELGNA